MNASLELSGDQRGDWLLDVPPVKRRAGALSLESQIARSWRFSLRPLLATVKAMCRPSGEICGSVGMRRLAISSMVTVFDWISDIRFLPWRDVAALECGC